MDGFITVLVLKHVDVPGYGTYKPGDLAGFEKSVAQALIQQQSARPSQEVSPTTPASSTNPGPEQAPRRQVAEATAVLHKPGAVAVPSPRVQEAAAGAYLERTLLEPRLRTSPSWAKRVPVVTASSHRLAAAVAFLREVLRKPTPATEVLTLAKQRGISRATLRRAKQALGTVKVQKVGMRAGWTWMIHEGTLWG